MVAALYRSRVAGYFKKIDNPRVSIRIKEELNNKAQDLVLNERKRRASSIP